MRGLDHGGRKRGEGKRGGGKEEKGGATTLFPSNSLAARGASPRPGSADIRKKKKKKEGEKR